ncbi:aldo/keto reductase [candidate division KSB1 bacterium]|nr:MAG: aldo/keto reductase [candidate division KSB1 bacterium]
MEYRQLGQSDLKISTVGFGCWAMGKYGWGADVDDNDSIRAVHRALELGINFFDTADIYGRGHSEEVLGKALGARRKDVIVATKVGNRWNPNRPEEVRVDLSREYILKAVDDSLRRLQTDYIDLYQIHRHDPNQPIAEIMATLVELVKQGKIRYIGTSNLSVPQLEEYLAHGPVVSIQPPLSLFVRHTEVQLLPFCQQHSVGVVVYSPLAMGLLTGKYSQPTKFPPNDFRANNFLFQGQTFKRNIAIVKALKDYAAEKNHTVAQLAVAWVLAHPAVTSAICGAKRPAQIEETAAASDWHLEESTLQDIDHIVFGTPA